MKNLNVRILIVSVTAFFAIGVALPVLRAADAKPKYTIEKVMEDLHKGRTSVSKRVSDGNGTQEDFDKLVEYYASLPLCDPPKGDKADWQKRATALFAAAKGLQAKKPDALAAYKKAVSCKACHDAHRAD